MGEIFKHIQSMRDCDKPVSYENISTLLQNKGYKLKDIEYAINYTKTKERRELYELTKEGGAWNRFNWLLTSITLSLVSLFLLYISIFYTVKLFDGSVLAKYGYAPSNVTIGSIVSFFILWLLTGSAIPSSIGAYRKYLKLKKDYFKKKKQGLL